FEDTPGNAVQVLLNSPVLSQRKLRQLLAMPRFADAHVLLRLNLGAGESLEQALHRLRDEAEAAVRGGATMVLLTDRYPEPGQAVVPALLAPGAVHPHLVATGQRGRANVVVEAGAARGAHAIACLVGVGATAVYPYLAYQTIAALGRSGVVAGKIGNAPAELGRS